MLADIVVGLLAPFGKTGGSLFGDGGLQQVCETQPWLFGRPRGGGRLSIQMGYGAGSPDTVPYEADFTTALTTNRGCDVEVRSPAQVERDLGAAGFTQFEYWIRPTGPGDTHPHWIFFTAVKKGLA